MEQQRVFLAIALSLGVLFVWQYFFMPPPEPPPEQAAQVDKNAPVHGVTPDKGNQPSVNKGTDPKGDTGAEPIPSEPIKVIPLNEDLALKTKAFEAVFTNKGGRLKSFKILEPTQYAPRGDLVKPVDDDEDNPVGDEYLKYLSFGLSGDLPGLTELTMFDVTEQTETSITLRHEVPNIYTLTKRFVLDDTSPHGFRLEVSVSNDSKQALSHKLDLVFYGHSPEGSGEFSLFDPLPDITEGLCFSDGDDERAPRTDLESPVNIPTSATWGGIDSRYFIMAAINADDPFKSCNFSMVGGDYIRSALALDPLSLAPGEKRDYTWATFVGPKIVETMTSYDVRLEESVDYGIFAFLCRPIRWLMVFFHGWVGNWGLAIILLTFVLRMLMFPINQTAYKNMEGMRRIQEPMAALREKYKDDPMKMQEQLMKMYKDEGVSPFGCLPQLLQIPIFFALYRTIYSSVELYNAAFVGWYVDLSAPDPYFVLPVLVGLLMVGQQLMMPTTTTNPQMKYVMWAMPVMFAAFTFVLPSGLGLYLFVSIGLGISQQYFIRKSHEKKEDPKAAAAA